MARAGMFADVDVVLHWHPGDHNEASFSSTLSNKSAKFRFAGQAAHASSARLLFRNSSTRLCVRKSSGIVGIVTVPGSVVNES